MKKNKTMKKYAPKVEYRFTDDTKPDDFSGARIELDGSVSVAVEGCRGVTEYDCDSITLNCKPPSE